MTQPQLKPLYPQDMAEALYIARHELPDGTPAQLRARATNIYHWYFDGRWVPNNDSWTWEDAS